MGKHTINIRVLVEPIQPANTDNDPLEKLTPSKTKDEVLVETPLTGVSRLEKSSTPKKSNLQKLIK